MAFNTYEEPATPRTRKPTAFGKWDAKKAIAFYRYGGWGFEPNTILDVMNQFHCDYDEVVDLFRKYNVHVHSWDQKDKRVRPSIISHMVCDYRNVTQCSYATLALIFNYSDRRIARQAAAASPFTTVKTGERICHDEEPWGEVRWDANFLVDFVGHSPTVIAKNAIKIIRSRYNVYDSVPATIRTRKGVKIPMAIKNEIIWYTQEYGMEVDDFMNIAATL